MNKKLKIRIKCISKQFALPAVCLSVLNSSGERGRGVCVYININRAPEKQVTDWSTGELVHYNHGICGQEKFVEEAISISSLNALLFWRQIRVIN